MIAILRSALIFLSLLLMSLCQATEDETLGIERTHTTSMTIALDIVAEIQAMKPKRKPALQQSSLDTTNESYTRTDWPGLCVMSSLVREIQSRNREVIKEFKDKLDEIRDHELFHVEENWTLEYTNGQVSASLSDGK